MLNVCLFVLFFTSTNVYTLHMKLLEQKTSVDNYLSALDSNTDNIVDIVVGKLIFLGPSMQGKTVTRLRLTKIIKNISSSEYDKTNTGVCEQGAVIITKDMKHEIALVKNDDWIPIDIEDESQICLNFLEKMPEAPLCTVGKPEHEVEQSIISNNLIPPKSDDPCLQTYSTDAEAKDEPVALKGSTAAGASLRISLEDLHFSDDDIRYILEQKEVYDLESLKLKLDQGCLLYIQDTGGQPELMDCLPALTIGPALYLLFCKLNTNLNDHYLIGYRGSDGNTLPLQSHFTVKETLFSALASVASMGYSVTDHVTDISQQVSNRESSVYIIGTHKDKAEESIDTFDSELQDILSTTFFYREGLIKWWYENDLPTNCDITKIALPRLVYPLDNMNGDDQEIHCLQASIEKKFKMFARKKIPSQWLIFSILLRKQKEAVMSLRSCLSLGQKLKMTEDETKSALHFLHYNLGICMFFSNVPALEDKVITDTQSVYKSLTTLIETAFKPGVVNILDAKNFKMTGIFCIEKFEILQGYVISLRTLVYILDHLSIIAPIHSDNKERTLYFMPCILPNSSDQDLMIYEGKQTVSIFPSPLYIRFKCGFVPLGVFSAMVANIIHSESQKVSCPLCFIKSVSSNGRKSELTTDMLFCKLPLCHLIYFFFMC